MNSEKFRDDGLEVVFAEDIPHWRKWLTENHTKSVSIWLVIFHKKSGVPSINYDDAVDEALCFGWIDSKPNKRDENSYYQLFSKRNPKSNWSGVNKKKVRRLIEEGRFTKVGFEMVELAKSTGTWDALNEVDQLILPDDLIVAFSEYKNADRYFAAFPPSVKRGILEWIFNAKRPATRAKRIAETAKLAEQNIRANQYRK